MGLGTVWGPLIAWYLFLAGMGAGACMVAWGASLLGAKYNSLVKPGVFLGAPLVAIGSLLLLLDLGNPLRFYLGFFRPQSSMISVGIFIITVFIVLGAVHIAALLFKQVKLSASAVKWVFGIAAVFALATAIYTGLLLGVVKAVPFWNTPLLPLLSGWSSAIERQTYRSKPCDGFPVAFFGPQRYTNGLRVSHPVAALWIDGEVRLE
jgi:polysulfide reductase chain C